MHADKFFFANQIQNFPHVHLASRLMAVCWSTITVKSYRLKKLSNIEISAGQKAPQNHISGAQSFVKYCPHFFHLLAELEYSNVEIGLAMCVQGFLQLSSNSSETQSNWWFRTASWHNWNLNLFTFLHFCIYTLWWNLDEMRHLFISPSFKSCLLAGAQMGKNKKF